MNSLPEWVWENDLEELPDDDHQRCIAAPGRRLLSCGSQLFELTTRSDAGRSAPCTAGDPTSFSTLRMEYLGLDWPRGLAQQFWGGERFRNGPHGATVRQAAGLALLATVAGALAAGSTIRRGCASPSRVGHDDFRQPARPPGWPPRPHSRRSSPAFAVSGSSGPAARATPKAETGRLLTPDSSVPDEMVSARLAAALDERTTSEATTNEG